MPTVGTFFILPTVYIIITYLARCPQIIFLLLLLYQPGRTDFFFVVGKKSWI
jgi:hypothetical protein